jgi:hypothetical protein
LTSLNGHSKSHKRKASSTVGTVPRACPGTTMTTTPPCGRHNPYTSLHILSRKRSSIQTQSIRTPSANRQHSRSVNLRCCFLIDLDQCDLPAPLHARATLYGHNSSSNPRWATVGSSCEVIFSTIYKPVSMLK